MESVSYQNKFENASHHCSNLLIRCMDFRFHRDLDQLIQEFYSEEGGFGDYDSPGVGGGASKAIIDEVSQPVVFGAINIAKEKHQIERIIVVDHIDCGAYGGSSRFKDQEEEEKFHVEELRKAKSILSQKYPDLKIEILFQDWNSLKKVD